MKKAITLFVSICMLLNSIVCFAAPSQEKNAYFYGNHESNAMLAEKSQGFTPVMTPAATEPEGTLDPDDLLVPPKQDEPEEGVTRWGLQGQAWHGAAQWANYTGIRSDGRLNVDKCAAGVRFDVEKSGMYQIQADFYNNSPANGHIQYIFLKSGEIKRTLFAFDTNTITDSADHMIKKGSRVQTIEHYLNAGDALYFVLDSKGQGAGGVYSNLEVTVTECKEDAIGAGFTAKTAENYVFGDKEKNSFAELGQQNFFPVFLKAAAAPANLPIEHALGSNMEVAQEENASKWMRKGYTYAGVRADGRLAAEYSAVGVAWIAPAKDTYCVNTHFKLNGTAPKALFYNVYSITAKGVELLFSHDTSKTEDIKTSADIEVALDAADKLVFVLDSGFQPMANLYPHAYVSITHKKIVTPDPEPNPDPDSNPDPDPDPDSKPDPDPNPDPDSKPEPDPVEPAPSEDYAQDFVPAVKEDYVFGDKTKNGFAAMGEQNFFPVFSKDTNKKENFPVWNMCGSDQPVIVEEEANKWSHSDFVYAGIRADGRLAAENSTVGVAWIAPKDGKYVYTTSIKYNGKASHPMYYSVYHGLADKTQATRLYVYDDSVDGEKGTKKGAVELKKGDRLFFILDSCNQPMKNIYPHALIAIREETEPKLEVKNSYTFGGRAANEFGYLGSQNFFPVAGPAANTAEKYPLSDMAICETLSVEEKANRWGNPVFEWLGVRADGRVYPSKYTAGVKWIAPANGDYTFDAKFFGTQPRAGLIYGIYLKKAGIDGEEKLLYSLDTKGNSGERYEEATESVVRSVAMEKGDELYFLINSKGMDGSYYPYLRLNIQPEGHLPSTGLDSTALHIMGVISMCSAAIMLMLLKKNHGTAKDS